MYDEKGESEDLADYGDDNLEEYLFPEPEDGEYDEEEDEFLEKERESGDGQVVTKECFRSAGTYIFKR